MQDLATLLAELGLGKYEAAFAVHDVDLDALAHLTDQDFEAIGIPLGPRRKILAALEVRAAPSAHPPPADGDAQTDRRPVTVLFADLAGFTALSRNLDAEELAAIMQAYFSCIDRITAQHGGIVERHIGDCLMAVFGAPVARGNDTERAVAAALAMAAAMPALTAETGHPLAIHIGVASGQVVASRTGCEENRLFTVTGESVNLASRLADAAPAGEIYLSDRVRRELGERLDCSEIGMLAIHGFDQPVPAWRALGLRTHRPQHELVGRRIELAQLCTILDLAREAGRGHVIHLRGEAGIGKTRLLEEVLALAGRRGLACHAAHVVDFGAGVGQDAVGVLVRSLTGLAQAELHGEAPARTLAKGEDAIFLMALAGVPHPQELRDVYVALDERTREAGKRTALRRLVEQASRAGALVLAVEDLHWADAATLSHLADIAAATTACPAFLIATSRPELEPLDKLLRIGAARVSLTTIDLGPLTTGDARLLADSVFSGDAEIANRCVERAEGNPLFLEQLLRHALEGESASVPATVASLVQARLDRLNPPERALLQAASVLGQRFEREALAAVLGERDFAPERMTQGMLVHAGREIGFAHALIHEAVYESLLRSRRSELHLRAADWFAGRDLSLRAAHLDRAGDPRAPRAYFEAAQSCAVYFQHAQAQSLVERGLELARQEADRHALSSLAGDVHRAMGLLPAALASYERALAAAARDIEKCRAFIGCAAVKRVTDDLDGAFRDLEAAQALAEASGATLEQAKIHSLRGNLYFPKGDIAGCIREHERALALAREAGSDEEVAAALGGLGDAQYMLGRMLSARARFSECVTLCAERGFIGTEAANRPILAFTGWFAGDARGTASDAVDAIALAKSIGHRRAEIIAHHAACFSLHSLSEYALSLQHAEDALRLSQQLGAPRFEAEALALRAKLLMETGHPTEALDSARTSVDLVRRTAITFVGPICLGVLAAATGDVREATAALDEADGLLESGALSLNQLVYRQHAIEICLARRDFDRAARYGRELAAYTREPFAWSRFYVERTEALVRIGRGERSAELSARLRALQEDAERFGFLRDRPEIKGF